MGGQSWLVAAVLLAVSTASVDAYWQSWQWPVFPVPCTNLTAKADLQSAVSPNFPNHYNNNEVLCWNITAITPGHNVSLVFRNFSLSHGGNCGDHLDIYKANDMGGVYCGSGAPFNHTVAHFNTSVMIYLETNSANTSSGFVFDYYTANNPCDSANCNSGMCIPTVGNNYYCMCNGGYYGEHCESGLGACASSPCHNNGTCQTVSGGHMCICQTGFSGTQCQYGPTGNACTYNPCMNNGTCHLQPTTAGYYCTCPAPYTGYVCETYYYYTTYSASNSTDYYTTEAPGNTTVFYGLDCAKLYVDASHQALESPNYPYNYYNNVEMCWELIPLNGGTVHVQFEAMDLEYQSYCEYDVVRLYNGHLDSDHLLSEHCGTSMAGPLIGGVNTSMIVYFKTDSSVTGDGFRLTYSTSDTQETTIPANCVYLWATGAPYTLTSPNYPSNYDNNEELCWRIEVAAGERVFISWTSFDLEYQTTCSYDKVEVYDGDASHLLGMFCGSTLPWDFTGSVGNAVIVYFKSDGSTTFTGFELFYSTSSIPAQPACAELSATDYAQDIYSPNWPSDYNANSNACWIIHASSSYDRIYLNVMSLDLEYHWTCAKDNLTFIDGSGPYSYALNTLCGDDSLPGQIVSSFNWMYVSFKSDAYVQGNGFRLTYSTSPTYEMSCEHIYLGEWDTYYQNVTSPGFPWNDYPANVDSCWVITADWDRQVEVQVFTSVLEWSYTCASDYLEFRDGDSEYSTLLTTFCGDLTPSAYVSTGNSFYIRFHSDFSTEEMGFSIGYRTYTDQVYCEYLSAYDGYSVLSSPGYPGSYSNNLDVCWVITAYEYYGFMEITASMFETEDGLDELYIYDGDSEGHPLITTWSGHEVQGSHVYTSGYSVYMHFTTDGSVTYSGFQLEYTSNPYGDTTEPYPDFGYGCVTLWADDYYNSISSMNYPYNYMNDLDQCWTIEASIYGSQLEININDMYLEDCGDCSCDFLEIRDGTSEYSPVMGRYCGSHSYVFLRTSGSTAYIRFKTDGSVQNSGFTLDFYQTPYGASPYPPTYNGGDDDSVTIIGIVSGSVVGGIIVVTLIIAVSVYVSCRMRRTRSNAATGGSSRPAAGAAGAPAVANTVPMHMMAPPQQMMMTAGASGGRVAQPMMLIAVPPQQQQQQQTGMPVTVAQAPPTYGQVMQAEPTDVMIDTPKQKIMMQENEISKI